MLTLFSDRFSLFICILYTIWSIIRNFDKFIIINFFFSSSSLFFCIITLMIILCIIWLILLGKMENNFANKNNEDNCESWWQNYLHPHNEGLWIMLLFLGVFYVRSRLMLCLFTVMMMVSKEVAMELWGWEYVFSHMWDILNFIIICVITLMSMWRERYAHCMSYQHC